LHSRQLERRAIAALAARAVRGEPGLVPEHDDRHVGLACGRDRLFEAFAGRLRDVAAAREVHARPETLSQRVEDARRLDCRLLDLGAPRGRLLGERILAAVQNVVERLDVGRVRVVAEEVPGVVRTRADERDRAEIGCERKGSVVSKQDEALAGGLAGEFLLAARAARRTCPRGLDERLLEQPELELGAEDAPDRFVERLRRHETATRGVEERLVVAVARRELDVDAGLESLQGRILDVDGEAMVVRELSDGEVVGDHAAVEPPFVTEERREQLAVGGAGHSVDLVVGVHHRLHAGEPDGSLEGVKVDVVKLAGGDLRRRPVPATLGRAVADKMLRGRDHA
jgi:hypothetical protein